VSTLSVDASTVPDFTWINGLLRYKNMIWVGNDSDLQNKLLAAFHSSAVGWGVHSSFPVTYRRIKHMFAWKGLKKATLEFVHSCLICQQAKPDRTKKPGLLQPLSVPEGAGSVIIMDFVEGLPVSGIASCILVIVDKFTKYDHFLALKHPYIVASVSKVFLDQVYRLHGLPNTIVSDRDNVFTSSF
jgi:hypothetical protein